MFQLYGFNSSLLRPSGNYTDVSKIKPGDCVINWTGNRSYVKSCKLIPHHDSIDLGSVYKVQQWPTHVIIANNQKLYTSRKQWITCKDIISKEALLVFPYNNIDWDLPSHLKLHYAYGKDSIKLDYDFGFLLGCSYISYHYNNGKLLLGDPSLTTKITEVLQKLLNGQGYKINKIYNYITFDEPWQDIFKVFNPKNTFPEVLMNSNSEFAQGVYKGVIDSIRIHQYVNKHIFQTIFLMILFSKSLNDKSIIHDDAYMYFMMYDYISCSSAFNKDYVHHPPVYHLQLTEHSDGLICNNMIIGSI